jgi:hypothetical protein
MAPLTRAISIAIAACLGLALAGCANDGSGMFGATTTASIPEKPKVDPACVTLTSQIDSLRREGIAEKVEKAAVKKYKMTAADLTKAAQLNKTNAEFQDKCSATSMKTAMMPSAGGADATSSAEARQTRAQAAVSASSPVISGGQ